MDNKRFLKIASNFSQNYHHLKREWYKDSKYWLNHCIIQEEIIMPNR
jgi:hypothetical protein